MVWIKDKKILAVTPRPEFKPFFDLEYTGKSNYTLQVRPRGALDSKLQTVAYLTEVLCPEIVDINGSRRKIPRRLWAEVIKERDNKALRKLAKDYGVSYETVRRIISKSLDF